MRKAGGDAGFFVGVILPICAMEQLLPKLV